MLATLPSMHSDINQPHDYSSYKHSSQSRYSPPPSPRHLPSFFNSHETSMNNTHRGLPAPIGMSLAPPERPQTMSSTLGSLPAPPSQWTGHDDSMKNWLQAKAEEDRRKQEEERTKQETLRLDQRKIEQSMLRESLSGGIPPPMVPLLFSGLSQSNGGLNSQTLEWAQSYLAQLSLENQRQQQQLQIQEQQFQQQRQQMHHPPSPDLHRENSRMIPPNPYGSQHNSTQSIAPPHIASNRGLAHSTSNPSLSRLNTAELQPQPMPTSAPSSRQSTGPHPLQQSQTAQSESSPGPGLFFHHWTPPTNTGGQPPTPSAKSQQGSPYSQQPTSHLRSDYQTTPKKRKLGQSGTSAGQSEQSPPTSSHRENSPLERSHSRQHSETSSRDEHRVIARPSSRQQRHDESSNHYPPRSFSGHGENTAR